jgi:tetratricopeptide (TPR) repeat protein
LAAYHYQEGGQDLSAFRLWSVAGDLAAGRSAAREAATHYQSALALLPRLLDTQQRAEHDLELSMKLANALTQCEGYSSPGPHQAYARARSIALELGQTDKYISACVDMAPTLFAQARYRDVLDLLSDMSAQQSTDMDSIQRIHYGAMMGVAHTCLGDFDQAWQAVEEAKRLDDIVACTHERPVGGGDPAIVLRSYGMLLRHHQGFPEQAARMAEEGMVIARKRGHSFTLAWAMQAQARMLVHKGAFGEAAALSTEALEVCAKQGFTARQGVLLVARGRAYLHLGRLPEGLADLKRGFDLWSSAGGKFHQTQYAAEAADALYQCGMCREADEFLSRGEQVQHDTEDRIVAAELLRLRGCLLLANDQVPVALQHLRDAISLAERRGLKLVELRASLDLAQILRAVGREREAASLVKCIYDWFTEGFEFPPLISAKAFLETTPV